MVLIGPESTGKTRLTEDLAARHRVPFSAEYARTYVERQRATLSYADVEPIARGQRQVEDAALLSAERAGAPLVLLDTDLVSTMVYSRHYYGACPPRVEEAAWRRRGELYLLHHVDVDWKADGPQREQPDRRGELFGRFRTVLAALDGTRVVEIQGVWDERRQRAIEAIEWLLTSGRSGS